MNATVFHKRMGQTKQTDSKSRSATLQRLSDDVCRIATRLAEFSAGSSEVEPAAPFLDQGKEPNVSLSTVRQVIRARQIRAKYFAEDLFSDPAWDMLLDLLRAEIVRQRVSVSSLCVAAAVPPTTALRWINTLTSAGLFVRRPDPRDGRRVFIELSPSASLSLRHYPKDVGNDVAI